MIVSVNTIECDRHHFALHVTVDDVTVAPESFDPRRPLILQCAWNQLYMSLGANRISAPYSLNLYFGIEGVQQLREFSTSEVFEALKGSNTILGMLVDAFSPDYDARLGPFHKLFGKS